MRVSLPFALTVSLAAGVIVASCSQPTVSTDRTSQININDVCTVAPTTFKADDIGIVGWGDNYTSAVVRNIKLALCRDVLVPSGQEVTYWQLDYDYKAVRWEVSQELYIDFIGMSGTTLIHHAITVPTPSHECKGQHVRKAGTIDFDFRGKVKSITASGKTFPWHDRKPTDHTC